MKRRLEYVMTAEEHGDLTNIIGSEIKNIEEIIHLEPNKNWSKVEMLGFFVGIKENLERADKILRNA